MSAIYKKEASTYLHTMPAYIFMSGFLFCGGLLFSSHNIIGQSTDLKPVWHGLLYGLLVVTPVLTMRLVAAERVDKTDVLLMSAPVSSWAVTAAKFFAALSVFALTLGISLLYPIILCLFGAPSWGVILTGYLGVFLFGMILIAIGLFVSSLMKRPLIAFLSAFGIMLLIMLMDTAFSWIGSGIIKTVLQWLSPLGNAACFIGGFVSVSSIVYFLSVTMLFVFLTMRSLEHAKWSKGWRP